MDNDKNSQNSITTTATKEEKNFAAFYRKISTLIWNNVCESVQQCKNAAQRERIKQILEQHTQVVVEMAEQILAVLDSEEGKHPFMVLLNL